MELALWKRCTGLVTHAQKATLNQKKATQMAEEERNNCMRSVWFFHSSNIGREDTCLISANISQRKKMDCIYLDLR